MEFLRQLFYGAKEMISKTKVSLVDVPKWSEFNVETVYQEVYKDERFTKYLPEYNK